MSHGVVGVGLRPPRTDVATRDADPHDGLGDQSVGQGLADQVMDLLERRALRQSSDLGHQLTPQHGENLVDELLVAAPAGERIHDGGAHQIFVHLLTVSFAHELPLGEQAFVQGTDGTSAGEISFTKY